MRNVRIVLLVFVAVGLLSLTQKQKAYAAACSTTGTVGSVSVSIPIPASGEYILWARTQQVTPANNALLFEVNGNTCYGIGSASTPANSWLWTNYEGSDTGEVIKHSFNSSGNATIKIYAKKYDVRVDKIMLLGTNEQCETNGARPSGDGSNCENGLTVVVDDPDDPDPGENEDSVTPSIVTKDPENVSRVDYYLDGELVQSSQGAESFDASLIENGEYDLTTKVTYKDGTTDEVTQSINVVKDTSVLGKTKRWVKKNQQPIVLATGSISATGLVSGLYFFARYWRHRKLYLMHHGF